MSFSELQDKMLHDNTNIGNYHLQPPFLISQPRSHSPLENTYESFNEYSSDNQSLQLLIPTKTELDNVSTSIPLCNQYDSGYVHNSSLINSPYYTSMKNSLHHRALNNLKTSIQFQSTPNKSFCNIQQNEPKPKISENKNKIRVNFHSIVDLATSSITDDSKSSDESRLSTNLPQNLNTNLPNDFLNFNEKLKLMSDLITNKENSNDLITRTRRKPRTQINKQQKEILEYAYKVKSYPDSNEIEYLCNLLGFEENVIRVSFKFENYFLWLKC